MKNNYKYYYKNKWFSIVFAMWMVIIISLTAFLILEYMIPFSRNIKWIENSSKSYYEANSWIEEALLFVNQNMVGSESWTVLSSTSVWSSFNVNATWTTLPAPWTWNSSYDKDYDNE